MPLLRLGVADRALADAARVGGQRDGARAAHVARAARVDAVQLELAVPTELRSEYLGSRVFVRFDHGYEPLGVQIYRAFRRLLLRQFNV